MLGVPTRAAQLRLDLLVKINTELPREDRSCDHDIGQLSAEIVVVREAQTLAHGSPQALTLSPELSASRNAYQSGNPRRPAPAGHPPAP